jgi:hypothetical protein
MTLLTCFKCGFFFHNWDLDEHILLCEERPSNESLYSDYGQSLDTFDDDLEDQQAGWNDLENSLSSTFIRVKEMFEKGCNSLKLVS